MAGFSLRENLNEVSNKVVRVASQAYTAGDVVMLDRTSNSVDVIPGTSAGLTGDIYAVAQETVVSAATELLVTILEPSQVWEVESANASNADHRRLRLVLTDANTVNNTGSDSATDEAVCEQVGEVGATSDNRLLVRFLQSALAA